MVSQNIHSRNEKVMEHTDSVLRRSVNNKPGQVCLTPKLTVNSPTIVLFTYDRLSQRQAWSRSLSTSTQALQKPQKLVK